MGIGIVEKILIITTLILFITYGIICLIEFFEKKGKK